MFQSYNPETGRINYTLQMSPDGIEEIIEKFGEHLAEGDGGWQTHYVDIYTSPPVVREKQPQATRQDKTELYSGGKDFMILSALPVPCVLKIGGKRYEVDDGVFEWATLRAGDYSIEVEAVPFLTWKGEVRVV